MIKLIRILGSRLIRIGIYQKLAEVQDSKGESGRIVSSSFSPKSNIASTAIFYSSCIDDYSYVADHAKCAVTTIGRFCSIGPNVVCGWGKHPLNRPSTSPVFFSTLKQCGISFVKENCFDELEPVCIGHDVWIGANAVVLNGLTIGHGAVVAAGAVVTRDVAPYSIVGGVPAKPLRSRFSSQQIERLLRLKWWDFPDVFLEENALSFSSEDIESFLEWAEIRCCA